MDKTFMIPKQRYTICRLKLLFEKIGHYLFEIINQDLINHPIFLSKAYLGNSFFMWGGLVLSKVILRGLEYQTSSGSVRSFTAKEKHISSAGCLIFCFR